MVKKHVVCSCLLGKHVVLPILGFYLKIEIYSLSYGWNLNQSFNTPIFHFPFFSFKKITHFWLGILQAFFSE